MIDLPRRATLAAAALAALTAVALTAAPAARADAVEYLPTEHWAYDDLVALWSLGAVDSLSVSARPWGRMEIARALHRAAGTEAAADPRYERLAREFAKELAWLGDDGAPPETPPAVTLREDGSEIRVSLGAEGTASGAPASDLRLERGSGFFVDAHGYFRPNVFVITSVGAQRTEAGRSIGDALIKDTDFYLHTREAYVSANVGGFELLGGLTRTRWGPGASGTLLISDAADPYASLRVRRRFGGRIEFESLTGILVQSEDRYVASHRLTLHVSPGLAIGVAEAARYDAHSPQLLYVLNLLPYTLVERFTTENQSRAPEIDQRNNVMMSADVVWRVRSGARVWAELLADDLATESAGMPHRLAWQAGVALQRRVGDVPLEILLEHTKVFRFTYAVYYDRNFTFGGRPLGYELGPDVERYALQVRADPGPDWTATVALDLVRAGTGTLGEYWDPQMKMSPWSGADLTGTVESTADAVLSLAWTPRDNVRAEGGVGLRNVRNAGHVSGDDATDPEAFVRLFVRK